MIYGRHPFLAKALQNLQAAQLLLNEKLYDAAANRAYFAAHHAARAALSAEGFPIGADQRKVHKNVQEAFAGELVNRRKVYPGKQAVLNDLMALRHKADYDRANVSARDAKEQVREALAFVTAIEERLTDDH